MLVIIILCILLALYVLHYIINYNKVAQIYLNIPGPKIKFLVGNTLELLLSPVDLFRLGRIRASEYNGIYRFYGFNIGTINIYNPQDIEVVLSSMKYHEKSMVYKFLTPWLQEGLLLSKGTKWQNRRKILTPAFHFSVLQKYYPIVQENTLRLMRHLDTTSGKSVDITSILSEYTLHTICETAMGTKLSEEATDEAKLYIKSFHSLVKFLYIRFCNILYISDFIFNLSPAGMKQKKCVSAIHHFTKSVIQRRKNNFREEFQKENNDADHSPKRKVMLDLLLTVENKGLIDNKGIQEEVDTFMFEGHDTTASGLVYCLMSLANEQDVQDKVYKELQRTFGDDTRPATMEDLTKLRYLDCAIKESLRLYPPVPFISRKIPVETVLSNYTIPAGATCHIHIYDLHRQEHLFKNALKFDPDRFLPEFSVGRHNFAYIPFSAGPRNCIGQKFATIEMKSVISEILRKFKLVPVTRHSDLMFASDIVLRNSKPVYVQFVKRNN